MYLICIVVLVIAAIVTATVLIVNYNARPKPPVYELKLYDDNWEELEKNSSGNYLVRYKVAYDGTMKGFNAICYMDGKEFYRYVYRVERDDYNRPIPVKVWFQLGAGLNGFPVEKGEYVLYYEFNKSRKGVLFDTPLGLINADDLPNNNQVHHQVTLEII